MYFISLCLNGRGTVLFKHYWRLPRERWNAFSHSRRFLVIIQLIIPLWITMMSVSMSMLSLLVLSKARNQQQLKKSQFLTISTCPKFRPTTWVLLWFLQMDITWFQSPLKEHRIRSVSIFRLHRVTRPNRHPRLLEGFLCLDCKFYVSSFRRVFVEKSGVGGRCWLRMMWERERGLLWINVDLIVAWSEDVRIVRE